MLVFMIKKKKKQKKQRKKKKKAREDLIKKPCFLRKKRADGKKCQFFFLISKSQKTRERVEINLRCQSQKITHNWSTPLYISFQPHKNHLSVLKYIFQVQAQLIVYE